MAYQAGETKIVTADQATPNRRPMVNVKTDLP